MNNAIYKNKVLGIGFAIVAFFGTQNIAHGATTLSGDLPLYCQEGYPSYTLTFTFDDYATDTGCGAFDYWDISAKDYNGDRTTITVDGVKASSTNTSIVEFSIDPEEISLIESAGYIYTDFNYVCGNDPYDFLAMPSNSITVPTMGIQECLATTYGGMFPSGSETSLTANVSDFMSSGVMNFILVFAGLIIGFLILNMLMQFIRDVYSGKIETLSERGKRDREERERKAEERLNKK